MSNIKDKFESAKDKVIGKTKESLGRTTGSEETELNGKIQSQKADLVDKFGETKEKIAKKINDVLDKNKEDKEI